MKTALSYGLCAVFFVAEGFGGERTIRAGIYGGICGDGLLCEILQVLHVFTGFCPGFAGVCSRFLRRLDGFAEGFGGERTVRAGNYGGICGDVCQAFAEIGWICGGGLFCGECSRVATEGGVGI